MRVIILTQYYPPETGAPQARLSSLAEKLVVRGHEVTVLTAMPSYPAGKIYPGYGGLFSRETRKGISVIRTAVYPAQSAGFFRRLMNYFSFVLTSVFVGGWFVPRADYLLTESPPLFLGLSGFVLSRWKRARWIFNVSDLWPDSAVRLGKIREGSLSFRISSALESFFYKKAWCVTGQSRGIVASISVRFPGVRALLLSNGVETEIFSPERLYSVSSKVFPAFESLEGRKIVLYAGLHGLAQGLSQILEAADKLRNRPYLFILAGDGPEKKALQDQASRLELQNVRFLDSQPMEDIPDLLSRADIILIPLAVDIPGAVPSKLYEAMASGKPVVLAAAGEPAEIVRESGCGIAVNSGDVEGVCAALECLGGNEELRKTMSEKGRRAAQKSFDRKRIQENFIDLLEKEIL